MAGIFWVCTQSYAASGRVSRAWVEESDKSPDAFRPCNEKNECELVGREGETCVRDLSHTPFPYNNMGGRVEAGPFESKAKADEWAYNNLFCK